MPQLELDFDVRVPDEVTNPCRVHIKMSPKSASGYYAMADYRLVEPQPEDAVMRDAGRWQSWCWELKRKDSSGEPVHE